MPSPALTIVMLTVLLPLLLSSFNGQFVHVRAEPSDTSATKHQHPKSYTTTAATCTSSESSTSGTSCYPSAIAENKNMGIDSQDNFVEDYDDYYSTPPFVEPRLFFNGKIHTVILNDKKKDDDDVIVNISPPITTDMKSADTTENDIWDISNIEVANVHGCAAASMTTSTSTSTSKSYSIPIIGKMPQMTTQQSLSILQHTHTNGWNNGNNLWTQMTLQQRLHQIENVFLPELSKQRTKIIRVLMWEIGKNWKDAEAEFDRTVAFVKELIKLMREKEEFNPRGFESVGGTGVRIFSKRNAIGIVLCLGPYNYPLNETYATILPALLTGNILLLKIPAVGGLSHLLTLEAFSKALPPNTINFISGSGRKTLPPLMESGNIDALAFIGGRDAADKLLKGHPYPHRLKVFLQLEAKNMALLLKDLFDSEKADASPSSKKFTLDKALKEVIKGALSYNGQRCTALKIIFSPKGHGMHVAKELANKVDQMRIGVPWKRASEEGTKMLYSEITPLPNRKRVEYMQSLIEDAVSKGASIMNKNGGVIVNHNEYFDNGSIFDEDSVKEKERSVSDSSISSTSNLMVPAVLYPVTPDMNIYHEEQFGPIIPVAEYDSSTLSQILKYGLEGIFGQQVSIFTSHGASGDASLLLDQFAAVYGKININQQCGRSPDTVPFSARRSSGMGVMSVEDALKEFSIPTVVAYKDDGGDEIEDGSTNMAVKSIQRDSGFLSVVS